MTLPPCFNILVTSIGAKVSLIRAFHESIEKHNGLLIGVDCDSFAVAGEFCHKFFTLPAAADPLFSEKIKQICRENQIHLVIPTREEELTFWKKQKDVTIQIACSEITCLEICCNKIKTDAWLRENKFPSVPFILVEDALKCNPYKEFPLIAKDPEGSGSRQIRWIYNEEEIAFVPKHWMLQPKLDGDEYTINLYIDKQHHCRCAIPHKRIQVIDGEVNRAITVKNKKIMQLAKEIGEKLPGAYGPINIQVFYNPTSEEITVTDINPRFGGGYPLAHAAGGLFTDWLILEALGKKLEIIEDNWTPNLLMRRYRESIFCLL